MGYNPFTNWGEPLSYLGFACWGPLSLPWRGQPVKPGLDHQATWGGCVQFHWKDSQLAGDGAEGGQAVRYFLGSQNQQFHVPRFQSLTPEMKRHWANVPASSWEREPCSKSFAAWFPRIDLWCTISLGVPASGNWSQQFDSSNWVVSDSWNDDRHL